MKILCCIDCQESDVISIGSFVDSEFEWIDTSRENFKIAGIRALLEKNEKFTDLFCLTSDQILIRWINYHLTNAKCWRRVTDLTMDLQDGVIYTYLLNQIAPRGSNICNSPLLEKNKEKRAIAFLKEADKIGCRFHLTPEDLLGNSFTVHLVYVFRLFLKYPGLPMTAPLAESENFDL